MARHQRITRRIRDAVAFEHPETVVMHLLQDTLGATRRALRLAHPSCTMATRKLHDLDHAERLAAIMEAHLIEMDHLLDAYQNALRYQAILQELAQLDLPF